MKVFSAPHPTHMQDIFDAMRKAPQQEPLPVDETTTMSEMDQKI